MTRRVASKICQCRKKGSLVHAGLIGALGKGKVAGGRLNLTYIFEGLGGVRSLTVAVEHALLDVD